MFLGSNSAVLAIAPKVGAIGLLLVATGLVLVGLTLRFWSSARPESLALAPLEIMSDRRYQKATRDERAAMVEDVRGLVSAAPRGVVRQTTGSTSKYLTTNSPSIEPTSAQPTRRTPIDPLIK